MTGRIEPLPTVREWAERTGIPATTIRAAIDSGALVGGPVPGTVRPFRVAVSEMERWLAELLPGGGDDE